MEMLKELQMAIAPPLGNDMWIVTTEIPRYACASAPDLQLAICRCYVHAILGQTVEVPEVL